MSDEQYPGASKLHGSVHERKGTGGLRRPSPARPYQLSYQTLGQVGTSFRARSLRRQVRVKWSCVLCLFVGGYVGVKRTRDACSV